MSEVLLSRQPVCDKDQGLFGYALQFGPQEALDAAGPDKAAATVFQSLLEIGLESLAGRHAAFLKLTPRLVVDETYRSLPRESAILLLPAAAEHDAALGRAIERAKNKGYRVALDDDGAGRMSPLLQLADLAFVDVALLDEATIRSRADARERPRLDLVAKNVATRESFLSCRKSGFKYFQGAFLYEPDVVRHKSVSADRLSLLRLLAQVQDPRADFGEIQKIIQRNPALSYRLLRYVNSAAFSLPTKVESIRQTVVLLGLERVRTCVLLLVLMDLDDVPDELLTTGLVRAHMCKSLAGVIDKGHEETAFTIGLLSVLDAAMHRPMKEVLDPLPLTDAVKAALLRREGREGEVLATALSCEAGDWTPALREQIATGTLRQSYLDAIRWASEVRADTLEPVA